MTFIQAFSMAINAIRAKKVRSFLTMLGTIIGVAAVIILFSVSEAKNKKTLEQMMWMGSNTVQVNGWRYTDYGRPIEKGQSVFEQLSRYVVTDMSDVVVGITPTAQDWGKKVQFGNKSTGDNFQFYYGSEYFSLCTGYSIERGRDICYMDVQTANRVCVIGSRTADYLFGFKEPIGQQLNVAGFPFEVIGVYKQKDTTSENVDWSPDMMMAVPYTTTKYLNPSMQIEQFSVKCKDSFSVLPAKAKLEEFMGTIIERDKNGYFYVYAETEYLSEIEETSRGDTLFLVFVAFISLFVGGIGIMNIMLVTVTERTREIGIRKAIGAPRRSIITQFLIEASVLSLCGGLIGVVCGFVGTLFMAKIQLNLIVPPNLFITGIAVLISIALGIGFGIYPAAKASALQPVVALRNE